MSPHHAWTLLLLFVVTLAPASAKQERLRDELITVLRSDAEMHSAIARAREGLAAFWEVFSPCRHNEANAANLRPSTKAVLTTYEEASSVLGLELSGRIDLAEAGSGKWMPRHEEQGLAGGGFPQIFRQAPLAEVEWYRQLLAEP